MDYSWLKWVHLLSAMTLLITVIGIAFFKLWSDRQDNIREQYVVMRSVVLVDWVITVPAVVIQPVTGIWLALRNGYPLDQGWVPMATVFFFIAVACWLPVVRLQTAMKNQVRAALESGTALSPQYDLYIDRYKNLWTMLGVPASGALLVVFFLMVFGRVDW